MGAKHFAFVRQCLNRFGPSLYSPVFFESNSRLTSIRIPSSLKREFSQMRYAKLGPLRMVRKNSEKPKLENQPDYEKENEDDASDPKSARDKKPSGSDNVPWVAILIGSAVIWYSYQLLPGSSSEITFNQFLSEYLANDMVEKLVVFDKNTVKVILKKEHPHNNILYFSIGSIEFFEKSMEQAQIEMGKDRSNFVPIFYEQTGPSPIALALNYAPSILMIYIMFSLWRASNNMRGGGGIGQSIFSVGKSKAKLYNAETSVKVKFKDVAGMDEAKEEIQEFVKFLKEPQKYQRLGAKIPKGAIISGPPGTGKTLIAKATAGEAEVPFLSVSGSEFVEMFVGVGSSRVRDLFKEARELSPCIVFIDEIDAIGKARGKGGIMGGGNDERENTLNQLLVEMDGFVSSDQIIVLAGTNRPDVLDPALTRPGRFDRIIAIDKPDLKGRTDIFQVHLKPIKISSDKKEIASKLAYMTPGFAGADIANVCNEAALIAARLGDSSVEQKHFELAIERVIAGLEKKSRVLSPEEKKIIAYHEAGHAVAGWFLEHADPLLKVSIIPRGIGALGYAQYLPKDQYLFSIAQIADRICMTLAGRIAEEIFFGPECITTGAKDDLQKITKLAYSQVVTYGMNNKIGALSFESDSQDQSPFQQKPYSEETARIIDEEVRSIITAAYERTRELLNGKKPQIEALASKLLESEVLSREDVLNLLGPRPFTKLHPFDSYLKH